MSASKKSVREATSALRAPAASSVFAPGRNCTRVAHADRVSLIVDGEDYFKAFVQAAEKAQRSIFVVGWDFHSRTRLHQDSSSRFPELLGDFLNFLVKRRRSLNVHVLVWDHPVIFSKGRELSPIYGLGWRPKRRVHLCYDDHYPIGASQHQKIVTIDGGAIAFCGGLDLTRSRWDTCEHKPGDIRRVNVGEEEKPYAPFHDTMMAVDGDAARALDEIVRARWERSTRRRIGRPQPEVDAWPADLTVSVKDVDVAISRTVASMHNQPPVKEVEALYLDMIASAKQSIYIENQYFTANSLGEALLKRLQEPEGPEIIAVMRLSTEGWLEAPSMGTLRTVLLRKLRDADKYGHFHPFYPHLPCLPDGQCCDLHSKLMIVDDESMRIGSANFSNRSMGLDTECDVAIEARGEPRIAEVIRAFRNRLLAEHLGKSAEEVDAKHREVGSLSRAIDAFKCDERSLLRYEKLDEPSEALMAVAAVADPDQPMPLDRLIEELGPDATRPARPAWVSVLGLVLGIGALAALWRYSPLAAWTDSAQVAIWAESFSAVRWAPLLVLFAYTPASLVLFPRPILTLFAVVAFGVWGGFLIAFVGILVAAALTYYLGRNLNRDIVRRIAGARLNRLSQVMRRRGLLAMTAIRLVPIAPFAVVNIVAGTIHVPLRHFMLGSALGILPGTLVATVFGDQLASGLRNPASVNVWLIVAVAALLAVATWGVRRWLFVSRPEVHGAVGSGKA